MSYFKSTSNSLNRCHHRKGVFTLRPLRSTRFFLMLDFRGFLSHDLGFTLCNIRWLSYSLSPSLQSGKFCSVQSEQSRLLRASYLHVSSSKIERRVFGVNACQVWREEPRCLGRLKNVLLIAACDSPIWRLKTSANVYLLFVYYPLSYNLWLRGTYTRIFSGV